MSKEDTGWRCGAQIEASALSVPKSAVGVRHDALVSAMSAILLAMLFVQLNGGQRQSLAEFELSQDIQLALYVLAGTPGAAGG